MTLRNGSDYTTNLKGTYHVQVHQHEVQRHLPLPPPHHLLLHLLHLMTLLHSRHSQMCCLEYHTAEQQPIHTASLKL